MPQSSSGSTNECRWAPAHEVEPLGLLLGLGCLPYRFAKDYHRVIRHPYRSASSSDLRRGYSLL
jgi:hypothetical protein